MPIKELQYGQQDNVLMSFVTSSLPIGVLRGFSLGRLDITSSMAEVDNALIINHNEGTVTVKIDWGQYAVMQRIVDFTLTVKYRGRSVDELTLGVRIRPKPPVTEVGVSQRQITWSEDMHVDLWVEPAHAPGENWQFLQGTKTLRIPADSRFQPVDGNNAVQFDACERTVVRLKYSAPQPFNPITTNVTARVVAVIDEETPSSFDITLIPDRSQRYRVDITRLQSSYTIGSGDLDLWKIKVINENPVVQLSVHNIITDSDKLRVRYLGKYEWMLSLRSVDSLQEIPVNDIEVRAEVLAGNPMLRRELVLTLSPQAGDNRHWIQVEKKECLQFRREGDGNAPVVVFHNSTTMQITLDLKNVHRSVTARNIQISSEDGDINIVDECRRIVSLAPENSIPVSVSVAPTVAVGRHRATINVTGMFSLPCSYVLEYEVKEKQPCSLGVDIVDGTLAQTFADENYIDHKVCVVRLRACVDPDYGIAGSLPIQVCDIVQSPMFSIRTSATQIEPGKAIKCDLLLNGTINVEEHVRNFEKKITFEYEQSDSNTNNN